MSGDSNVIQNIFHKPPQERRQKTKQTPPPKPIRSELPLPEGNVTLERPELMNTLKDYFKDPHGVKTIAFMGVVGMGGVGKTTLARLWGRYHSKQYPQAVVGSLMLKLKCL